MDPIHQFEITNFFVFGHIGGLEIAFTKSALFMLISLAFIALLMLGTTGARAMVPGRMQSVAEMSYEFVANTLQSTAGTGGDEVLSAGVLLFMFVLTVNIIGLIPYTFAVTAQIIITVSLALPGVRDGDGLRLLEARACTSSSCSCRAAFRSTSCRWCLIEVLSFLSRPVSHSLRLFANILAGHITLKVFAGFVTMLGALRLSRLGRGDPAVRHDGRAHRA